MSRKQLIEFGIIAIAIIMVYKAIEAIFSLIVTTYYNFRYGSEGFSDALIQYLVFIVIYLAIFFLFIKKRHAIIAFIDNTPPTGEDMEETKPLISISQQEALYIVFIILAVISLVSALGGIINYLVGYFADQVKQGIKESGRYGDFKSNFIKIILASLVIIFSRPLAEFFARRNSKLPDFEFEKEDE